MKRHIILLYTFLIALNHAQDLSEIVNNFGLELLYFTHQDIEHNVVLSPFGIWTLMIGVTLGATDESREQLDSILRLPENDTIIISSYTNLMTAVLNENKTIQTRNCMFIDIDIILLKEFANSLTNDFNTMLLPLNFKESISAAVVANRIILDSGLRVTDSIYPNDFVGSKVLLTNVIMFRGFWKSPFNINNTKLEEFYSENSSEIVTQYVNMMHTTGQFIYYDMDALKSQLLQLEYTEQFSMLVILPHTNVTLNDVYKQFEKITFKDILKALELEEWKVVQVSLPRFKISSNLILNRPLIKMGVFDIFDKKLASFKKASSDDIYVSKIVHKVDIEVTESGVATEETRHFFHNTTETFVANRPFIYFVIEKTTDTIAVAGIYSE